MHKILRNLLVGLFALAATSVNALAADPENTLVIELKTGSVVIEMLPDLAPTHVARIKELAREGFYDGIVFHRVIAGFMAQTGDPTGTGTSGSGKKLKAEFSREPYTRGTVGMARSNQVNSADSQFFIMFKRTPSLDGKYTVWGQVIQGMEHVDSIKKGAAGSGKVDGPDKMLSVKVLADMQ
ncbi:peptidylprolyl isomerase [Kiloniella antarctica]|uniref:Peptidyl-prolyl cis-trans isomerase n=1 Tax=Kiloniella antarctica TaxID=1550907 RepID=A0ABW5BSW0_9PROT